MRRDEIALLLAPHLGELTRFARWLSAAPHEADDIVQETLIRALNGAHKLENRSAMRAWAFRIARNVHVDLRRSRASYERFVVLEGGLEDLAEVEMTSASLPSTIDSIDLERALLKLPESSRTALLLTDLWEFDHEEVARILDVPIGTVKSRVARARVRVAALLTAGDATKRGRKDA